MDDTELIAMLEGGLAVKDIAEELSVSEGTIRNRMKALGINAQRAAEPAFVDQLIARYQADEPVTELLREYKISFTKLYGILAKHDIPTRKSANANARQKQLDEAVQMYEDGFAIHKIVSETGVPQPTLHAELHERGVQLRRPRRTNDIAANSSE